jgi:hypothetical protein
MDLPINYKKASTRQRREAREQYGVLQDGKCHHCGNPLTQEPTPDILRMRISRHVFPMGFFNHPVHLHHSHDTGLTIGAVHAKCNAVLWEYHDE